MLVFRDAAPLRGVARSPPARRRIMSTVANQSEPITRQGYERLRVELEELVTIKRRQLADDLREAREDGTEPGENRPVAEAMDDHAALERRIDELETALAFARIVDPPVDGTAGIGQRLTIRLAPGATPIEYHLVGPVEADPAARRISVESPVGQALVGHSAGDTVHVETPGGRRVVEIVSVGG
jgi:transcription elongation factor GreA